MTDRNHQRSVSMLLYLLTALTLYRAWVTVYQQMPLYLDEAQYWFWSLTPDWGYYSKPPMVAWIIRVFGGLGEGELFVRLGTLLLHPLTALLLYALGRKMFDVRTGWWAAVLFISLPLVGFNSLFMTTDAPLFFFWGLAVYALWRALENDRWRDWLLLGLAAGLGLMSKYSMALFAPSAALVLCLPAYRRYWLNPRLYAAAALALLVFLPNLLWNLQMDFISFRHTAEISRLDQGLFHPDKLGEFIAGQLGCMGPIAFVFLLIALFSRSVWRDSRLGFLAAMTLPFIAVISAQALLAKANVNWAAPTYFAGSLLVAARWTMRAHKRWWLAAVISNLLLLSAFYHYHALAEIAGVKLTRKTDPYSRILGWPQMGAGISRVLAQHPDARLAVMDRGAFVLLSYYTRPRVEQTRIWNPEGLRQNHFHLTADMKTDIGSNFILAARTPLNGNVASAFEYWTPLGAVSVPLYAGDSLKLYLYRGDRFKGYTR